MADNNNGRKRIAVKIGSNVLTLRNGLPNLNLIKSLCSQIAELRKKGHELVLVSSGAVAAGRSLIKIDPKLDTVSQRQLLSSIGQVKLMEIYSDFFKEEALLCAQVLVTKQDFSSRQHYLNMKNCFETQFKSSIVPIVNENDVVSVTELMFTDNDELAGLVSSMVNADELYILTNVDGIYDRPPEQAEAMVIPVFEEKLYKLENIASEKKSSFGRGGILTKCHSALKISKMGIPVRIVNGLEDNVVVRLSEGEPIGTLFPAIKGTSSLKRWIAHSSNYVCGTIVVNDGAKEKLCSKMAVSLLPIGIKSIEGEFKKGDLVRIVDEHGNEIGLGKTKFNDKNVKEKIGLKNQRPVIHYDHMFLH